jgi:3,4-dihydroxy 2-butanone 4-phosphate synthase / GTP cyclohydrolase II
MLLADWLIREKIKRIDFAKRIDVTPQTITGYCDGDFWPKKAVAERIFKETNGEVTPNDFLSIRKDGKTAFIAAKPAKRERA